MSAPQESDPPKIFACRLDISVRMRGVLAVPLSVVVWPFRFLNFGPLS